MMMDKNEYGGDWALVTPVDTGVEREKKGYDVLQDDVIKCADCDKKLVSVIKVKEDDSQHKIVKVICPCGGESFIYEIVGQTYIDPVQDRVIGDMPTEMIDGVMHITIEVIK